MTEKIEKVYKIFVWDEKYGLKTLFHPIEKNRQINYQTWMYADKKMRTDGPGGKEYLTGIHCFKTLKTAEKYLKRFHAERNYMIVKCSALNLRQKPTNPEVWLADAIFVKQPRHWR